MKNMEIIFCVGIPASGKSTWSGEFVKNNTNYVRVCRDDYRYMFKNVGWFEDEIRNDLENLITKNVYRDTMNLIDLGFNVILDETNLNKKHLLDSIENFKSKGVDVKFKIFDITFEEAIIRDFNRDRRVGDKVIKAMYDKFKYIMDNVSL